MALFGSARDASLIRSMNREVINRIIDSEVDIYRISVNDTQTNIYDEATQKNYYDPIRARSLFKKEDVEIESVDGPPIKKSVIKFAFLKDDLKILNYVPREGDIISYDSDYYEIDLVNEKQYWGSRNTTNMIGYTQNEISEFGWDISMIVDCHLTKQSKLSLVSNLHTGNDSNIKKVNQRKKSIYD